MKTFRVHYVVNSHRHTLDMRADNPGEARERFPKLAVRVHGNDPSIRILKVKRLRQNA